MLQGTLLAEDLEPGRAVYNYRCYFCHGYSGDARTLAARFLDPAPRNFTTVTSEQLPRDAMIQAVTAGRPDTAMKPFGKLLSRRDILAVVDFIREEFMSKGRRNTQYHTVDNGWPNHHRYAPAFPFATGEIPLDTPWEKLNARQRRGHALFFASCISCHDRSHVSEGGILWEQEAVSYPRFEYMSGDAQNPPDSITGATPFARHDIPLPLKSLSLQEEQGQRLFLANCAFCHGADGTGKNWIGRFLAPHPRNLTDPVAMSGMTRAALRRVIRRGLPGTSMPAWEAVLNDAEVESVIAYISKAFHPLPVSATDTRPSSR